MFHIRDNFKDGSPITSVGAGWFNSVGKFLNNLVGGHAIKVTKTDGGIPVIDVDEAQLNIGGTALNPPFQTGANIDSDSAIDGAQFLNNPNVTAAALRKTWTRGDTDSQGNKVGTKLTVCTGMKRYQVGVLTTTQALYSVLSFDENGCLCKVETAQSWYKAD